jgi:hypothetical protein
MEDARKKWEEAPLEELLEGISVNNEINVALEVLNSVRLWRSEEIDEPRDHIEEWLLDNGVSKRQVYEQWENPTIFAALDRAELQYFLLEMLEREFEEKRRIVWSWQPENEQLLPFTLDEYITELRDYEKQIHQQSLAVARHAKVVREVINEELERSFNAARVVPADS